MEYRFYWPSAIVRNRDGSGTPFLMASGESYFTIGEAWDVIRNYNRHFEVLCAWIGDGRGGIIDFECYTDSYGWTNYHGKKIEGGTT